MTSEELAMYFIDTYNETGNKKEFTREVDRQTTIHDIRIIESIWHTLDMLMQGTYG